MPHKISAAESKGNEEQTLTSDSIEKYNMENNFHSSDSDSDSDEEPSFPYEYRGKQKNNIGSVEGTVARATKDLSDESEDELDKRAADKKNKDGKKVKKTGAKKNP
ncbi:hypothetical protein BYT27DRAFT_7238695 [Phlegmacium glaucopus]|nr:hypothetical protein BYT27DRAFT_7238695 [Phlegmacium glaucopus]